MVSVIIPAFNAEKWIIPCLNSVVAQTYANLEVIVIDDGSSDRTAYLVESNFVSAVRLIRQRNGGQARATAVGVDASRGEFVAFLDSDDIWIPEKLEIQVAYLRRNPQVDAVYTDAEEFHELGLDHQSYIDLHRALREPENLMLAMIHRDIPLRSTVVIRKSFLKKSEVRIDPESGSVDDIGLFMEMIARNGRFGVIERATALRRMHSENFSRNHFQRFASRIPMYHRLISRCSDCSRTWKLLVRRALSDAEYRVGECFWGGNDKQSARLHFIKALKANRLNLRAYMYAGATLLPDWAAQILRNWTKKLRNLVKSKQSRH